MKKLLFAMVIASTLSLPSGVAHGATTFLTKSEAKREAGGYARRFCDGLEDCIGSKVGSSYDCTRISARQVECTAQFAYTASDAVCDVTIRVTEYTRYYNRRIVNSPDCY